MVQRLTYRRQKSYNTKSNGIVGVRTPGGKVVAHYLKKRASLPVCGDTGKQLFGIPALRPFAMKSLAKRKRSVSRAYGGVLSASAVRQRICRAFLLEEASLVKAVAKTRAAEAKKATKATVAEKKPVQKSKKTVKKN